MDDNNSTEGYQERTCFIRDAKHHEDLGNDDEPGYSQSVRLSLEDEKTGRLFCIDLSEADVRRIAHLDYELNAKEMIKYAAILRDWEQPVKMLCPPNGQKVTTDMLLNTRASENPELGKPNRTADVKRFGFPLKGKE